MKHLVLMLAVVLVALSPAHADDVYKWVDAQGNVHYSDKPHPGARKLNVAPPQTYAAPKPAAAPNRPEPSGKTDINAQTAYSISVSSPEQNANLWNTHSVTVSVAVSPGLGEGGMVTFTLDGQSQGPVNGTSATFDNVARGQHTVSATLRTADGQTVSAKPVTFYVHQTSVNHPKPPR